MIRALALILMNAIEEYERNDQIHDDNHGNHHEESIQVRWIITLYAEITFHVICLNDSSASKHINSNQEERRLEQIECEQHACAAEVLLSLNIRAECEERENVDNDVHYDIENEHQDEFDEFIADSN